MIVDFNFNCPDSYAQFKAVRRLPRYHTQGRSIVVPDEYAGLIGLSAGISERELGWSPSDFLFDYQREIVRIAIRKQKFAIFADCGLGKTIMLAEFAMHCLSEGKRTLIVSPLMVCKQTADEVNRFYGRRPQIVPAAKLQAWLDGEGDDLAITNYEAIRDGLTRGKLGALILDESSMLKSAYGKFGTRLIELGKGLEYKLALTGTPAPNDRIEFANHAVFLDQHRTVNAFLARYFVNRGQTANRWELKPHALKPFYRDLSTWCIFVSDPTVYGWQSVGDIPPIHVHMEEIELTPEQKAAVTDLMSKSKGGIGQRSKLSQIAKGQYKGQQIPTNKFDYMRDLMATWPKESTIIWCRFNNEQDQLAEFFPHAANIAGKTPQAIREELIDDFKIGLRDKLLSKPKVLGFGLNLQVATRHVFSSCDDSYELFYQAIKRSNRIGSTRPLNVHLALTEIERPMVQNVLDKADRVEADTRMQEELFKELNQWND